MQKAGNGFFASFSTYCAILNWVDLNFFLLLTVLLICLATVGWVFASYITSNISIASVFSGPGQDLAATEDLSGGRTGTSVEAASGFETAAGTAATADYPWPEGTS